MGRRENTGVTKNKYKVIKQNTVNKQKLYEATWYPLQGFEDLQRKKQMNYLDPKPNR